MTPLPPPSPSFWERWKYTQGYPATLFSFNRSTILRLCTLVGGKSRILQLLYACFPPHRTYIEPFGGSYVVLLNKPPSPIELINDIDPKITALAYCYLLCRDDLLKATQYEIHSQGLFQFLQQYTDPQQTMLELALQKLYLLYHSFSAMGESFAYALNEERIPKIHLTKDLVDAVQQRLAPVHIFSEDFRVFIKRHYKVKKGFIYVDAPYTVTARGQHYDYNFTKRDHRDLFRLLDVFDVSQVKWLASYDKSPFIEQLYARYTINEITVPYSLDTKPGTERTKTELFISNYDISAHLPSGEKSITPLDTFLQS